MSSPLSDTYSVAGYISQLSHISIPPLQNDDNRLPALRGDTDCLTLTIKRPHKLNVCKALNYLAEKVGFEPT